MATAVAATKPFTLDACVRMAADLRQWAPAILAKHGDARPELEEHIRALDSWARPFMDATRSQPSHNSLKLVMFIKASERFRDPAYISEVLMDLMPQLMANVGGPWLDSQYVQRVVPVEGTVRFYELAFDAALML